jgi:hypothetical protein
MRSLYLRRTERPLAACILLTSLAAAPAGATGPWRAPRAATSSAAAPVVAAAYRDALALWLTTAERTRLDVMTVTDAGPAEPLALARHAVDRAVHTFLPLALTAAGDTDAAARVRTLGPIDVGVDGARGAAVADGLCPQPRACAPSARTARAAVLRLTQAAQHDYAAPRGSGAVARVAALQAAREAAEHAADLGYLATAAGADRTVVVDAALALLRELTGSARERGALQEPAPGVPAAPHGARELGGRAQ